MPLLPCLRQPTCELASCAAASPYKLAPSLRQQRRRRRKAPRIWDAAEDLAWRLKKNKNQKDCLQWYAKMRGGWQGCLKRWGGGEAGSTKKKTKKKTSSRVEEGCSFFFLCVYGGYKTRLVVLNFRLVMLMEKVQAQQMRSVPTEVVCV